MAITQAMCSSFKQQVLQGTHALDVDTIKIALYTSSATMGATTTVYSATNEVVGPGYTAGGNTLAGASVTLDGTTGICTFTNSSWISSTITARGALIYNSSKANKAIAVLDFGADKISSFGTFTISFPADDAADAIIRIA